ncbi:sulfotransferase domain-containing protein [Candidatus Pelagibacter bacterium]|nr:sulfotransferase domain-containing protein [Candidatus Pelagibacter bacterium]
MIIWLSSYPKSGNTWLRVLLTNYLFSDKKVFSNLNYIREYPKKYFFKDLDEETNTGLPGLELYKYFILSQDRFNLNKVNFLKTHSICGTINNYKFTDKENTLGFIYIIRDPRSVAISYAHHSNLSYEKTAEIITNENHVVFDRDKIVTARSSWKINYLSWFKSPYPRIIIKYEDLHKDTFGNFKKILYFLNTFIKIEIDEDKIHKTIKKCSFDNLKHEEENFGFSERMGNDNFFRKGLIDEWKSKLSLKSIKLIEDKFKKEMIELNYL